MFTWDVFEAGCAQSAWGGVGWWGLGVEGGREGGELAAGIDAEQFGEGETVCCTHPWREHGDHVIEFSGSGKSLFWLA